MADDPNDVVLYDAQGIEHRFPKGFDRQRAQAIVRNTVPSLQLQVDPRGLPDGTPPPVKVDPRGLHESVGPRTPLTENPYQYDPGGWQTATSIGRGISAAADVLNPKGMVTGMYAMARHPVDTYNNMVDASADQFSKMSQEWDLAKQSRAQALSAPSPSEREAGQEGALSSAIAAGGHGLAALLPGVGPAAARSGEEIAKGNVATGIGEGIGQVLTVPITEYGGRGTGFLLKKLAPKIMDAALWRSEAEKANFPDTPQRLIDESQVGFTLRQKPGMMPPPFSLDRVPERPYPERWGPSPEDTGPQAGRLVPRFLRNEAGGKFLSYADRVKLYAQQTENELHALTQAHADVRPPVAGYLPPARTWVRQQTPGGEWPAGLNAEDTPFGRKGTAVEQQGWMTQPESDAQGPTGRDMFNADVNRVEPYGHRFNTNFGRFEPYVDQPWEPGQGAPPGRVDPAELVKKAQASAVEAGRIPGLGTNLSRIPQYQELLQHARDYLGGYDRPIDAPELLQGKRAAADQVVYHHGPNATPSNQGGVNFFKGLARADRQQLIDWVPETEPGLAREQDLIGARRALARKRPMPMTGPGIVRTVSMGPELLGRGAILMDRFGKMLANPYMTRTAMLGSMLGESGVQTAAGVDNQGDAKKQPDEIYVTIGK